MFCWGGGDALAACPVPSIFNPEDGTDECDEDGDGNLTVNRRYLSAMEVPPMGPSAFDFQLPAGATYGSGLVTIQQDGGADRTLHLKYPLPGSSGQVTGVVAVEEDTTGGACSLLLGQGGTPCTHALSPGIVVASCPTLNPAAALTQVDITCGPGGDHLTVDWLAIQNGPYVFPPMVDQALTVEGMGEPMGGAVSVVRTDDSRTLMFAGSNVGGFAWSDDGANWNTANGRSFDLDNHSDLGVFEVAAYDDDGVWATDPRLYALTGYQYSSAGHLWESDDMGNSWEIVSWDDDSFGAFKYVDDCSNNGTDDGSYQEDKHVGSGKQLLVEYASSTSSHDVMYIASGEEQQDKAGNPLPGRRGIWVMNLFTQDICEPYDPTTLPTSLNPNVGYDAIPSGMALGPVEFEFGSDGALDDIDVLLVGYRVVPGPTSTVLDRTALYACPSVLSSGWSCGMPQLDCEPVIDDDAGTSAEIDVRDIEVSPDPEHPFEARFLIADGGRRSREGVEGAGDWECTEDSDENPSTVLVLSIYAAGAHLGFDLYDTDGVGSRPSWAVDTTGAPVDYYVDGNSHFAAEGCPTKSGILTTEGELVPPTPSGTADEISTIVVDPDNEWVFAMYPFNDGNLQYGCVRVFRAPIDALAEGLTPWEPVQGWVATEMGNGVWPNESAAPGDQQWGPHALQRNAHVRMRDSWLKEFGQPDIYAPAYASDAEFIDIVPEHPEGELWDDTYQLLVGSGELWWLPAAVTASGQAGWNTPVFDSAIPGTDPDNIPWTLAFYGEGGRAFQDTLVNAIATCHGCGAFGTDYVISAVQDQSYFRNEGSLGPLRSGAPAEQPAPFEKIGAGGSAVASGHFLDEESDEEVDVVWIAFQNQSDTLDTSGNRKLLYSRDGGDSYCWDAAEQVVRYMDNQFDPSSLWWLDGSDADFDGTQEFPACDLSSTDFDAISHLSDVDQVVGTIVDLAVIDARRALLLATPVCADTSCTAITGGGLWVVTWTSADGLFYEQVATDTTGWAGSCTGASVTGWDEEQARFWWYGHPRLAVHPDTDWDTLARVFVKFNNPGGGCTTPGLAEITFDPASPSTAYWRWDPLTQVSWDAVNARNVRSATNNMKGIATAPSGNTLLIYGGTEYSDNPANPESSRSTGWVTSIDLTVAPASSWPPSASASWTLPLSPVILADSTLPASGFPDYPGPLPMVVQTILPHPHVDNLWYFGGYSGSGGCGTCKASAVYALQRSWRPKPPAPGPTGEWRWGWYQVTGDDFENGRVASMDWGNAWEALTGPGVSALYLATLGSGPAEAVFTW